MRRADRLLQIIQILRRARRPYPASAIAEELEVSLRTIYRDIADLSANRVPIRGEAGVGYILEDGYDLPPLMFNTAELEAIILGMRMVQERCDAELQRGARDAVAKIEAVLPKELKSTFIDAPLYAAEYGQVVEDSVDVAQIRLAMREQFKLKISYSDADGKPSERIIWPISIGYFRAARVVVSWCELRVDFRSFRTDRIETMDLLDEKYRPRRAALFADWRKTCTMPEKGHRT
ncbi:MAG: transcriptional regulator [Hyphomicrobiales bacterium]|nr:YafY family transcriptional regulator [Hyphomicrobiales bacterium]PCJ90506.1 MAG: transcriptional regulator [Hyphomicrobiales bacterium]